MATSASIYFAGVATVVVAIGAGFGGALMLTHTSPAHKEPASGFAKRDEPVQSPKIISKAEAETTGSAPAATP